MPADNAAPLKVITNWRKVVVHEGDVYEFLYNVTSRDGNIHPVGSRLYVHNRTQDAPHGEINESGTNWYCCTSFGISVWATLEHCIARGLFQKVTRGEENPEAVLLPGVEECGVQAQQQSKD